MAEGAAGPAAALLLTPAAGGIAAQVLVSGRRRDAAEPNAPVAHGCGCGSRAAAALLLARRTAAAATREEAEERREKTAVGAGAIDAASAPQAGLPGVAGVRARAVARAESPQRARQEGERNQRASQESSGRPHTSCPPVWEVVGLHVPARQNSACVVDNNWLIARCGVKLVGLAGGASAAAAAAASGPSIRALDRAFALSHILHRRISKRRGLL